MSTNQTISRLCLLAFLSTATLSISAQNTHSGIERITVPELMKTVNYLASPVFEGRQPGSDGYYLAAGFMAEAFKKLKLQPLGNRDYYQELAVEYVRINDNPALTLLQDGIEKKSYRIGEDFVCRGMTGFGDLEGKLFFCGYGISEPAAGYDDYAGIDVKGKIALVFKQNPPFTLDGISFSQKYNRYRANKAKEHGAIALLLVSRPLMKNPQKPIGSIMDGEGSYLEDMPQIHIDLPVANELFEGMKYSLSDLQSIIDSLKQPKSMGLESSMHVFVQGEYIPDKTSMNVVGMLEGSDPDLKQEYIVVSAHLDHVGKQGENLYFPGANDNASGSSAVLQLARAFASLEKAPARSIIFVLYTSEEQGLFGSAFFAEQCPVDIQQIVAAINMDCIAYGDSIQIGNGKSNPVLWELAKRIDSANDQMSVARTWGGGGADLDGLYQQGVPGLYMVTTNSYDHLHLPSDKPETLNTELYEQLVKLAYRIIDKVASGSYQREEVISP